MFSSAIGQFIGMFVYLVSTVALLFIYVCVNFISLPVLHLAPYNPALLFETEVLAEGVYTIELN